MGDADDASRSTRPTPAAATLNKRYGTTYYWSTYALPRRQAPPRVGALRLLPPRRRHRRRPRRRRRSSVRAKALDRLRRPVLRRPRRRPLRRPGAEGRGPHRARLRTSTPTASRRFLRSMAMDLTVTEYDTWDDLLGYMDGSAAVIGEMMLPILEPLDPGRARAAPATSASPSSSPTSSATSPRTSTAAASTCPQEDLDRFGADPAPAAVDEPWRDADALRDRPLPRRSTARPTSASRCCRRRRPAASAPPACSTPRSSTASRPTGYDVFSPAGTGCRRGARPRLAGRMLRSPAALSADARARWCVAGWLAGARCCSGGCRRPRRRRRSPAPAAHGCRSSSRPATRRDTCRACSPRSRALDPPPLEVIVVDDGSDRRHRRRRRRARRGGARRRPSRRPAGSASRGPATWAPRRRHGDAPAVPRRRHLARTRRRSAGCSPRTDAERRAAVGAALPRAERPVRAAVGRVQRGRRCWASGVGAPRPRRAPPVAFGPCLLTARRPTTSAVGGTPRCAARWSRTRPRPRATGAPACPCAASAAATPCAFRMYPGGVALAGRGWTKNIAAGAGARSRRCPCSARSLWVDGAALSPSPSTPSPARRPPRCAVALGRPSRGRAVLDAPPRSVVPLAGPPSLFPVPLAAFVGIFVRSVAPCSRAGAVAGDAGAVAASTAAAVMRAAAGRRSDPVHARRRRRRWAVVHAGTGYAVHRLPLRAPRSTTAGCSRPAPVRSRRSRSTRDGSRIRRWKDRAPRGRRALRRRRSSKRRLPGRDTTGSSASSSRPAGPSSATGCADRRQPAVRAVEPAARPPLLMVVYGVAGQRAVHRHPALQPAARQRLRRRPAPPSRSRWPATSPVRRPRRRAARRGTTGSSIP